MDGPGSDTIKEPRGRGNTSEQNLHNYEKSLAEKIISKYFGIFRLISVFQTAAMLKFANSQHYPLAPFAKFIGSLMRL